MGKQNAIAYNRISKKKEENLILQHECHAFIDPENGMVVAQGWRKQGGNGERKVRV